MEKHEQEPQWYDTARKGPFREMKFKEAAADHVIRQIHAGGAAEDLVTPAAPRRRTFRVRMLSAAIILLMLGAGLLYLELDGSGSAGGFNPTAAAARTGIFEPPVAGQSVLTDDGLIEIADQTMQAQLGKKLPILFLERLKAPEEGIAAVHYKEGEDSAVVWIDTATGEVIRTNMNAYYPPEELDPAFIAEALGHLQDAGYKGEFTVTGLKHFVHYGLDSGRQGVQVTDGLIGTEGQIDYVDGEYERSTFNVEAGEATSVVQAAGLKALRLLRGQSAEQTDHLYSIKRTVAPKWDILVLTYGDNEYGSAIVMMDYATGNILQVFDYTLSDVRSSDSKIRGEQDTELLNMDTAELQRSAAAIVDELFGIRLEDYTVDTNMKSPGILTFTSPDGAAPVVASYNLDGTFYMIQQSLTPAE
ncbi:hypothetical protein [Paenibacillus sp. MMS20-IR301]|uniref:hypothetical protein n=1 Tax=Paenibacillus sp. MMS20-IR301 TaxID=2895946 RepID=UPI0028E7498F|nr:hypothetical protein [Paenibacillus sp. MMS20-IR301]WNS43386.1 hypothetical protein LOS79_31370 [Paenibacillus sp. MMS20-IR301]